MPQSLSTDALIVETMPDRERVVVTLSGELDIATVPAVVSVLTELRVAGWADVVLDLRELTFIDSTGLSLLLSAEHAFRALGGTFAIVDGSPEVARLLETVGLSDHFRRTTFPRSAFSHGHGARFAA